MLDSIEQMHLRSKFIHRDIKTSNFMIDQDRVFIIDFGLVTEWFKDNAHIKKEIN